MMKCLMIVCDGLGDRLTEGKTPLEAAETPRMDRFAKQGICGIMDTVRAGIRPGSDTSHLSLFGYDPMTVYTGRGPFEAAGAGLQMQDDDVAFRCNFATVVNGKIVDRRAGRAEHGLDALAEEIAKIKIKGVEVFFRKCAGHRAVVVFRGEKLSCRVRDTDPDVTDVPPVLSCSLDGKIDSKNTAKILNEFTMRSMEILAAHPMNKERVSRSFLPANIILCRGGGSRPHLDSFKDKYGMTAACVAGTTLIKGVCKSVGMDIIEVKGATGHIDSDICAKAQTAIEALKSYDFVFLHIKGTDEASHDGRFDLKRKMIERIDAEVVALALEWVKDTVIVLTADHSTPLSIRQHSADPVPIAIIGDVRSDDVSRFTERDCAKGGLCRICGRDLMNIILDLADRAKLFGA